MGRKTAKPTAGYVTPVWANAAWQHRTLTALEVEFVQTFRFARGFLNPRHHCRACGRLVCGQCSPSRILMDARPCPRVCKTDNLTALNCGHRGQTALQGREDNATACLRAVHAECAGGARTSGADAHHVAAIHPCITLGSHCSLPRPNATRRLQVLAAGTLNRSVARTLTGVGNSCICPFSFFALSVSLHGVYAFFRFQASRLRLLCPTQACTKRIQQISPSATRDSLLLPCRMLLRFVLL